MSKNKFNICLVCDFFYPRLGGVEMHIYYLALCLIERGHKVIIFTHSYDTRAGVRYITNGIKVYYSPFVQFHDQVVFFTFYGTLPLFRKILIREKIDIVHSHQGTSVLGIESIFHSRTMGYKSVFTDHSLFGFADAASIHVNKLLKCFLSDVDACISVSHTSRENLTLRASLNPHLISVIPNAVDAARFYPDPSKRYPLNTINIVFISRLTFRKGVDILISVIPPLCKKYPELHFIVGGDGPKRKILESTVEKHGLQKRVEILGSIPHKEVRNVLVRGHIFLNTSLTEAFCIAIVEAALSGLVVVSTNVGGIREVLPEDVVFLGNPDPEDIIKKVEEAIPLAKNINSQQIHDRLKDKYSWRDVAARTEKIYDRIMATPKPTLLDRIKRYYSSGPFVGIAMVFVIIFDLLLFALLTIFSPTKDIEPAVTFPYTEFAENRETYSDLKFQELPKKKQ